MRNGGVAVLRGRIDVVIGVLCCLVTGTQAAVGAFFSNLIQNGDASSGNFNGWTQAYGDSCTIASQGGYRVFTGPNNANVFDIKSCQIAQLVDVSFASKQALMNRVSLKISAVLGDSNPDYGWLAVTQQTSTGATIVTTHLDTPHDTTQPVTNLVPLSPACRKLYVTFTSQQGGLGFNCDAWATKIVVELQRRTPTSSASPSSTHMGGTATHSASTSLLAQSASATLSASSLGATQSVSSSRSISGAPATLSVTDSSTFTSSGEQTQSATTSRSTSATVRSLPLPMTPTSAVTSSVTMTAHSLSLKALSASVPQSSTRPSCTVTDSPSRSDSNTALSRSVSASASCGPPPPLYFQLQTSPADRTPYTLSLPGDVVGAVVPVVNLLTSSIITINVVIADGERRGWSVVGCTSAGVLRNATVASLSPPVLGPNDNVTTIVLAADSVNGWFFASRSVYVTQYAALTIYVRCPGQLLPSLYHVRVTARGLPLPYSTPVVTLAEITQVTTQIATNTLVPASLSAMRALARLASCGTASSSGMDTSSGIVRVPAALLGAVFPRFLLDGDALDMASYVLLCATVAVIVAISGTIVFGLVRGLMPPSAVAARIHIPSILCPAALFSLSPVLGVAVMMAVLDLRAQWFAAPVGIALCVAFCGWLSWVCLVDAPRHIIPVAVPTYYSRQTSHLNVTWLRRSVRLVAETVRFARHRVWSWRCKDDGESGREQRGSTWKLRHYVIFQDASRTWTPLVDVAAAVAVTVVAATVAAPGVGCQIAGVLTAMLYAAMTFFVILVRPYATPLSHLYALLSNVLTLAASAFLCLDIFEVEHQWATRISVALMLVVLGASTLKGAFDAVEFGLGLRALVHWIHRVRSNVPFATCGSLQLSAAYLLLLEDDEYVSSNDGDGSMGSNEPGIIELPQRLLPGFAELGGPVSAPQDTFRLSSATADIERRSASRSSLGQPRDAARTESAGALSDREAFSDTGEAVEPCMEQSSSFVLDGFDGDDDFIHAQWWRRQRAAQKDHDLGEDPTFCSDLRRPLTSEIL